MEATKLRDFFVKERVITSKFLCTLNHTFVARKVVHESDTIFSDINIKF